MSRFKGRMQKASTLAAQRATRWTVYLAPSRGGRHWRIVSAESEEQALKRGGKRALAARPSLSSREWRLIYEEVGLPH